MGIPVKNSHGLPFTSTEKIQQCREWCLNHLPMSFLGKKVILWHELFVIMSLYKDSKDDGT